MIEMAMNTFGNSSVLGLNVCLDKYDCVCNFEEGLAAVCLNGKWGFIDKTGKEVIPCKYDNAWKFQDGLAKVELNGKYGFINPKGKEIIQLIFDET